MARQVNATFCTGMGDTGKRRLKLYKERAKAAGYKSFSAYVVQLLDREADAMLEKASADTQRDPLRDSGVK